ncbi:MAG TPA: hypothetical protein VH350_09630 [Candidatus Sulfotelmatobacter sp.]|jgi:hypothetical protein|nr:hypothetical protein [Candidatus Sulfotelmatobacter sp.]
MKRLLWSIVLVAGCASAQVATPASPTANNNQPKAEGPNIPPQSARKAEEKIGLVRGVLKHLDPIHDQIVVRAFGGKDVKIAFDPRTQLLPGNATTASTKSTDWAAIPTGSVVSVDTVMESGKLFAVTVRTGPSTAAEMNGQVLRYDATRSRLILRDPLSPESVSFRVTGNTTVVNRGQASSPQALSEGTLVHLWFTPAENTVTKVEILAERGNSFTFQGRIVAVDLRSRVVAVSNDTDQAVHELSIASLDNNTLGLLREGTDVKIQAEFDGERYNAKTVSVLSHP